MVFSGNNEKTIGRSLDLPMVFWREHKERDIRRETGRVRRIFMERETYYRERIGRNTSQLFFGGENRKTSGKRKCIKPGGKKSKISFPQIAFLSGKNCKKNLSIIFAEKRYKEKTGKKIS